MNHYSTKWSPFFSVMKVFFARHRVSKRRGWKWCWILMGFHPHWLELRLTHVMFAAAQLAGRSDLNSTLSLQIVALVRLFAGISLHSEDRRSHSKWRGNQREIVRSLRLEGFTRWSAESCALGIVPCPTNLASHSLIARELVRLLNSCFETASLKCWGTPPFWGAFCWTEVPGLNFGLLHTPNLIFRKDAPILQSPRAPDLLRISRNPN